MNPQAILNLNRLFCALLIVIQLLAVGYIYRVVDGHKSPEPYIPYGMQISGLPEQSSPNIGALIWIAMLPFILIAGYNVVLLLAPRTRFWWRAHLVNQIIGLGYCIFLAVPLLVFWLKDDTKALFDEGTE